MYCDSDSALIILQSSKPSRLGIIQSEVLVLLPSFPCLLAIFNCGYRVPQFSQSCIK